MTTTDAAPLLAAYRAQTREAAGVSRWVPHLPTERQSAFLGLQCLEALYGGAAGGGKSVALLMAALQHVDVPSYSAALFRRTFTDLALPGAVMDLAHQWLGPTAARWIDQQKVWRFPSGATLAFGYLDGPRDHFRYQGAEFQFVGFDELTQFDERPYTYLFSRLRRPRAGADVPLRMRGATNPGGIGHRWVKRRFLDAPGERVFVPARLDDNPHLDADEYRAALAELDAVTRAQLESGQWVEDTSGHIYRVPASIDVESLPDLPDGESYAHVIGADFGVTDPTAYVVLAFSRHSPCVYVVRSGQWPGLAPSEAAETMRDWADEYEPERIVGDIGGLGKGFQAEFRRRYTLPMVAAQKSDKLGYIKLLGGALERGDVLALPGNGELLADLRGLAWKDERHREEHPACPNHLPDALLYGWREARGWQWTEREQRPEYGSRDWHRYQAEQRKDRMVERMRREVAEQEGWL